MKVLPSRSASRRLEPVQLFSLVKIALLLLAIPVSAVQMMSQGTTMHTIKVIGTDSTPVESVLIFPKMAQGQWVTNANGVARIPDLTGDTLVFQHLAFEHLELAWADLENSGFRVTLRARPFFLEELVLVGRTNERKGNLLHEVSNINRKQLITLQTTTSADVLEKTGNAFIQRSQLGGGSPILRGFEANRILLVVDGVRMNNLIYRSGHLQNSITVGPVGLEQMEVIYGPGSLLYGSDALGGVIHFRSRNPVWKTGDNRTWAGEGYVRYGTANQEKTIGGSLEWRNERWASRTSFSFSDIGDLRAGDNRPEKYPEFGERKYYVERIDGTDSLIENADANVQVGSAYSQWDLFHKTRFKASGTQFLEFNVQYSGSSDIPRYDQLNDPTRPDTMPRFAEWNYGPQKRLLVSAQWQNWEENAFFDKMNLIVSGQLIEESRITRFFRSDNRNTELEKVRVYGISMDMEKQLNPGREMFLKYGLEGIINDLNSSAWREDISTGQVFNDIFTRYPSKDAGSAQLGAYGIFSSKSLKSDVHFEAGVRYSYLRTTARYAVDPVIEWPEEYLSGLVNSNHALTGSIAVQLPYSDFLRQRFSLGTAFRAPNIDDMAKIRTKGDEAQIPNFDLGPENTWQGESTLELSFSRDRNQFRMAATGFYTRLNDAIIQAPLDLPNGSNILFIEGMPFTTFSNINAERGEIYGAGLAVEARGLNWGASVRGQYTHGRTLSGDVRQPMAHIPPVYGVLSVWYQIPFFKWQVTIPANGRKSLEDYSPDSSDNPEYATGEGSLAWYTVNLFTECTISEKLTALLSVENILDRHYRTFSSGISAPGRHISVTLMARF